MKPALLPILICPDCGARLDAIPGEGQLRCAAGHAWLVRGGVPRFTDEKYAESFGFQWSRFSRTQLDSANGSSESRETFEQKTGFPLASLAGKRVLDVGCGMGRFLEVVADAGAEAIGVDMSAAVDAAQANLGHRPNVHIVQGDLFSLPFGSGSFDRIYSIGVLHHTPDTRQAFARLPGLLKPGGRIAVWVYGSELRAYVVSDMLRPLTSRLHKPLLLAMCRAAIPLGRWQSRLPFGGLWNRLMPVSRHPDPDWRWLDTFDWYSPRYQHKHAWDDEIGVPVHALRGEARSAISAGDPRRALSGLRAVVLLRALMRRRRPDILHAFLPESCAVAAAAIGGTISPPLIVAKRGLVPSIRTAPFLSLLTRFANGRARVVHVNSEAVARSVGDIEGAPSGKMRIIYNGVDTQRFRPPEAPRNRSRARIGMLANFKPYKGHLDVLEAFDALSRDFAAAELWFWGSDGPSGQGVRERCRVRGLEARVRFLGVTRDPAAALRQTDVFVSASYEEGFSNSVLEAMAAGLPIVGTSAGGTVEQIEHGETGLLVQPGDTGALSGALRAILSDDDLASRLGSAARRRAVDRFSVERMVRETVALYEEVL